MLGEILFSFVYGIVKAKLLKQALPATDDLRWKFQHGVIDPLEQEAMFRAAPMIVTNERIPRGSTGLAEGILKGYDATHDQLLTGLTAGIAGYYYERVYRKHGFLAAWLSHVASNIGVYAGSDTLPVPK